VRRVRARSDDLVVQSGIPPAEYAAFSEFSLPVLRDSNHTARPHNQISPAEPALCPQSRNKRAKQRVISISSWDFVATMHSAALRFPRGSRRENSVKNHLACARARKSDRRLRADRRRREIKGITLLRPRIRIPFCPSLSLAHIERATCSLRETFTARQTIVSSSRLTLSIEP